MHDKVLSRKYPKGIVLTRVHPDGNLRPKGAFCWYYDNTFVHMSKKWSKDPNDILYTAVGDKASRKYAPLADIAWEIHAWERILDRDITQEQAYRVITHGHRLNCSDKWTKRWKYVLDDMEVLVDENNKKKPRVVQMHRNTLWESPGFVLYLNEIISEVKGKTGVIVDDITISCHDETLFTKKLASDPDMSHAWLTIQLLEHTAKTTGMTLEDNLALQDRHNYFISRWGTSTVWELSSLEHERVEKAAKQKGWRILPRCPRGIPEGWLPGTRHVYYLQFQLYHFEKTLPERMARLLEEYGIVEGPLVSVHSFGKGQDPFDRHITRVTLKPCSPNHWAIPKNL